uniref:ribosomal protein S11 n=1 Tax=Haramonas pauciplastida TaxID=478668 RepID=UPI0021151A49|nr:ribosomal protein S11 [Haramonas pauciplastida]UTE94961.1 ribosomal protein S11 [Haramonas pauciplastida]
MIKSSKKNLKKNLNVGVVHVKSTFNNTIITITDLIGNTVTWSSTGIVGFKGSKKGTPFAAQLACEDAIFKAKDYGIKKVEIILKGQGPGREAVLRTLSNKSNYRKLNRNRVRSFRISSITDITPIAFNGCRPPKRRRV